ncbi:MAG: hypothetical protein RIT04_507 [Candidatus Parcubacteria bacterium]|jgi:N6-L-threonylcarbamoyladenine synthase
MITLGIETSCDETALALIETRAKTDENTRATAGTEYRILAQTVFSQIDIHAVYGGVFPVLAKREHAKRLAPLLEHILTESNIATSPLSTTPESLNARKKILTDILSEKESDLLDTLVNSPIGNSLLSVRPAIDQIAVTRGPGLEPALWVGVNFARVLGLIWNIPVIGMNHMEGHIVGSLLPDAKTKSTGSKNADTFSPLHSIQYPALALLISGGHTELVEVQSIGSYKIVGATLDDAVGEAYDKVARMMNIPYPGGPVIARLAEQARGRKNPIILPRPMLHSPDINFSFSGLKTSVLYLIEKLKKSASGNEIDATTIENIALAFEDAVTEVLVTKTAKALDSTGATTLIVGGGVSANAHIRLALEQLAHERAIPILMPPAGVSGDNALMIALAGALSATATETAPAPISNKEKAASFDAASSAPIIAEGNLSL